MTITLVKMKFRYIIDKIYKLWNLHSPVRNKNWENQSSIKKTFKLCTSLKLLPSNKICREIVR